MNNSNEVKFRTSRKKFFYIYTFGLLLMLMYPVSEFSVIGGAFNYIFYALLAVIYIRWLGHFCLNFEIALDAWRKEFEGENTIRVGST